MINVYFLYRAEVVDNPFRIYTGNILFLTSFFLQIGVLIVVFETFPRGSDGRVKLSSPLKYTRCGY